LPIDCQRQHTYQHHCLDLDLGVVVCQVVVVAVVQFQALWLEEIDIFLVNLDLIWMKLEGVAEKVLLQMDQLVSVAFVVVDLVVPSKLD